MKKRSINSCSANRMQNPVQIKGGYRPHAIQWWPLHLQKQTLHVLEKFKIEKC